MEQIASSVGMDFGRALNALKDGKAVTREGWNGKGMWAAAQFPDANSKMTRPYLYLRAVDGSLGPWTPSATDLMSSDWQEALRDR